MLKIQRNSIWVVCPIFVVSGVLSAIFCYLADNRSFWFSYASNIMIGIMGSSLLSLILAIIGYYRERHAFFLNYYNKVFEIVNCLSRYKACFPNKKDLAKENAGILRDALGVKLHELGDIFGEAAFVWDKYDWRNRRQYLFNIYQYFTDMRTLTQSDWDNLEIDGCPEFILHHVDDVILDIKSWDHGTTIKNRACEDINTEFDTLIGLINGEKSDRRKLIFQKTPITDKVFKLLSEEDEAIVEIMNKKVQETRSRTIKASGTIAKRAKELFNKGLISSYSSNDKEIVSVKVSDKSYYYFGYKERYQKSKELK